jgi:hypothetical protein
MKLKGAAVRKNKAGVVLSLKLCKTEIHLVKYYVEMWADGPDLHSRHHEKPLSASQINKHGRK